MHRRLGLTILAALLTLACFQHGRMAPLIGPMKLTWPEIATWAGDSTPGVMEIGDEVARCADDIKTCSFQRMALYWPSVKQAALARIDADLTQNNISIGLAESRKESLRLFEESIDKIAILPAGGGS